MFRIFRKIYIRIMVSEKNLVFHLMAIFTVIVWGTTFVSTKILIECGLTSVDIFFYRFFLAYICIWPFSPHRLLAKSKKDELLFLAAGLCGGSLYFVAENTALGITLASNVSLIISTTPILTALLVFWFYRKERLKSGLIYGSFLALSGVAFVVFNGSFILKISPVGDLLTLLAALFWAFYCLILKQLDCHYSAMFMARKVFFYGLVTLLPMFVFHPLNIDWDILRQPVVFSNLLFLGIIASMLCYVIWNIVIHRLGAVRAANYIYINPFVTLIASAIVLGEKITPIALLGCAFILCGVYLAEKRS